MRSTCLRMMACHLICLFALPAVLLASAPCLGWLVCQIERHLNALMLHIILARRSQNGQTNIHLQEHALNTASNVVVVVHRSCVLSTWHWTTDGGRQTMYDVSFATEPCLILLIICLYFLFIYLVGFLGNVWPFIAVAAVVVTMGCRCFVRFFFSLFMGLHSGSISSVGYKSGLLVVLHALIALISFLCFFEN